MFNRFIKLSFFSIFIFLSLIVHAEDYVPNQLIVHFHEEVFEKEGEWSLLNSFPVEDIKIKNPQLKSLLDSFGLQSVKLIYDVDYALAGARKSHNDEEFKILSEAQQKLRFLYLLEFGEGTDLDLIRKSLNQTEVVKKFFYNSIIKSQANRPNDEFINEQWSLDSLFAFEAWDINYDSSDIVVGVIDGGFQEDHIDFLNTDLTSNVQHFDSLVQDLEDENGNLINEGDDPTSPFEACNIHGTFVAGIIGASGNNREDISGISWKSALNLYEVGQLEVDSFCDFHIDRIFLAIDHAVADGVRVINASFNLHPDFSEVYLSLPTILVVTGAGNDGRNLDQIRFYQEFSRGENTLLVGGHHQGGVSAHSNRGRNTVHLFAPSAHILSLLPDNRTGFLSGTSVAIPHVSAAAALAWSRCPDELRSSDIKEAILSTVQVQAVYEESISGGKLNLHALLQEIESYCDPDEDGFTRAEGDCDQNNVLINPSSEEQCFDGLDNDCDGVVDNHCYDHVITSVILPMVMDASAEEDNCFHNSNTDQVNSHGDGIGHACQCAFEQANTILSFDINSYRQLRPSLPLDLLKFHEKFHKDFLNLVLKDTRLMKKFAYLLKEGEVYVKDKSRIFSSSFIQSFNQFLDQVEQAGFMEVSIIRKRYFNHLKKKSLNQILKPKILLKNNSKRKGKENDK